MRSPRVLVVGVAATAFVPLIVVLVSYIRSNVYVHQVPLASSHPHVKEALVSLRATYFATSCLLPPLSSIAFLCDLQAKANSTEVKSGSILFRFAVDQGVLYDSLTFNTPSVDDFSLLSDMHNAADIMLTYDGVLLLHQDGVRKISGVGDVRLLLSIQKTSRMALYALYRVVLHVELSIARLSSIQTIALSGLTILEHVFSFGQGEISFDWLMNISSTSTAESTRWLRTELQSALVAYSTLEDLLEKLEASGVRCSIPANVDLCAKATPLLLGRTALQPLVVRLEDLTVDLGDWEDTLTGNEGATGRLMVAIPVLQTSQAVLEEKAQRIQKVRIFVEELLGLSYS